MKTLGIYGFNISGFNYSQMTWWSMTWFDLKFCWGTYSNWAHGQADVWEQVMWLMVNSSFLRDTHILNTLILFSPQWIYGNFSAVTETFASLKNGHKSEKILQ